MFLAALHSLISSLTSLTAKDVLASVWAPLSIFVGAWIAFYFNNRRSRQDRLDQEVTEGNLALSVLAEFHNQQLQYQRNFIEPHRGAPDAWFKIMAGPPLDSVKIELNRNNLGFLLQLNGAVWQQLVLEERRFNVVRLLVDDRNALLVKGWAKLEDAGIQHGSPLKSSEVEKILGPVLYQQLQQMGAALIEQVDQNVTSSMDAILALRAELCRAYPKRNFISIAVKPPRATGSGLQDKPAATSTPNRVLTLKRHQRPTGKYIPHEKD